MFTVIALLILGLIGSFLPILPGPPLSYIGLLIYHFFIYKINEKLIFWIGLFIVLVTIFDYILQIYGVKRAGGSKIAIRGSVIGMLLGLFLLPPFGILIGAFLGAFIGARIASDKNELKIAFGALWGFILGTILKLCISLYIICVLLF